MEATPIPTNFDVSEPHTRYRVQSCTDHFASDLLDPACSRQRDSPCRQPGDNGVALACRPQSPQHLDVQRRPANPADGLQIESGQCIEQLRRFAGARPGACQSRPNSGPSCLQNGDDLAAQQNPREAVVLVCRIADQR